MVRVVLLGFEQSDCWMAPVIAAFILGLLCGCLAVFGYLILRGASLKETPEPPKVACWIRESAEGIEAVRVMEMEDVK